MKAYKKQSNYCSRLYKREKKNFFCNLDFSFVEDNKHFWHNVKKYFSEKGRNTDNIILENDNNIISNKKEVCEELNSFFEKAADSLGNNENRLIVNNDIELNLNSVDRAIKRFVIHPSIL